MYDVSAARARVLTACFGVLGQIDTELRMLTGAVEAGTGAIARQEVGAYLQLTAELTVLREKIRHLLPQDNMGGEQHAASTRALLDAITKAVAEGREPPKLVYSRVEAGRILGLSPATVDRLVTRGLLRPSLATRRPLFSRAELERFMRESSQGVGP